MVKTNYEAIYNKVNTKELFIKECEKLGIKKQTATVQWNKQLEYHTGCSNKDFE